MRVKFLNQLQCSYLYKKSYFTRWLSCINAVDHANTMAWVHFKLGMYATVNRLTIIEPYHYHDLLAHAASSAACGKTDQLDQIIGYFESKFSDKISNLIEVIAPFNSSVALRLAEKYHVHSLHSLAIRLHEKDANIQPIHLQKFIDEKRKNFSNFTLLQAQLYFYLQQPQQVIRQVNQLFTHYHLNTIDYLDPTQPLNVNNIKTTVTKPDLIKHQTQLVSLLITTYNCADYIASTLQSLLNQSYANLEIIIVDDCSEDDTWHILQQFKQKDARIKIYQQPINLGTYIAKNRALVLASGEFCMCHDSDDWSHPKRIEKQLYPLLKDAKLIATTSEWFRISDQGEIYSRNIFPISRLNPSSPLFRREAIMKELGFWDNVRTGADSEFLARMRLIFGKKAIKKIAIPLAIGSHRSDSLMNAADTGFINQTIPSSRLEYWESWNSWHISALKNKTSLYLPLNSYLSQRQFSAPKNIVIDDHLLREYHNQIISKNELETI